MKENREGAVNNLKGQVKAFFGKCNEGSYESRDRNKESCLRFADYLGNNTNLQKMKNAEARHLYDYVDFMKNKGLAPATIMTDLSGIRFYYERNGCKNELPTNDKLNLDKRETGKYDRAWLPSEIERCYALANFKGRMDIITAMDFMLNFGLRIDEAASLKLTYLKRALNYGELMVTGKGGKQRVITFDEGGKHRAIIEKWLSFAENGGKYPTDYLICDKKHRSVEKKKKSMQNWLIRMKKQIIEPNREEITVAGNKPRKDTITFHGLRHTFAQNYLTELSYMDPKDARLKVSQTLGHERIEITRVYI